jgi:hypothetical protein
MPKTTTTNPAEQLSRPMLNLALAHCRRSRGPSQIALGRFTAKDELAPVSGDLPKGEIHIVTVEQLRAADAKLAAAEKAAKAAAKAKAGK